MINKFNYIALAFILFINACEISLEDALVPESEIENAIIDSEPLQEKSLKAMEGIYKFTEGVDLFGDLAIVKFNGSGLSFFCKKNSSFMLLKAGKYEDRIVFAGYYRFVESATIDFIKFEISDFETIQNILSGDDLSSLKLSGYYNSSLKKGISLEKADMLAEDDFLILGHRGGGRNTDRYPYSENSLEMLEYAEQLGANGVEIDVQQTKDGELVLFHDSFISSRLVREDYFIGKISDYSFPQLRSFCTLLHGEKIPTLKESLETIVFKTNLRFVWIDVKYTGMLEKIAELQQEYLLKAKSAGRDIEILIGIPDEEIFNEFIKLSDFENRPSLCELSEEFAIKAKSLVWAPNWSLGYLDERVLIMQELGFRVVTWTLDEPMFIKKFTLKAGFDGILSNFPTIVNYEYYSKY